MILHMHKQLYIRVSVWVGLVSIRSQQGRSGATAKLQDPCQTANHSKDSVGQPIAEWLGGL